MMVASGVATCDDCAMRVRATVVSRPTPECAVLEAGSKVLTSDQYYVQNYGYIPEYPEVVIPSLSEEHAVVDLSHCPDRLSVGEVVHVVPNHCCVVNTWSMRSTESAEIGLRSPGGLPCAGRFVSASGSRERPAADDHVYRTL